MIAEGSTSGSITSAAPAGDVMAVVGAAIFSAQPAALAAFYGMLFGVRFEHRVHPDGSDHRISRIGHVHFEIKALHAADGSDAPDAVAGATLGSSSSIELSFQVPDVDACIEHALRMGASALLPATTYDWGTFASVLDPDGNRVGLFQAPSTTTIEEGR